MPLKRFEKAAAKILLRWRNRARRAAYFFHPLRRAPLWFPAQGCALHAIASCRAAMEKRAHRLLPPGRDHRNNSKRED